MNAPYRSSPNWLFIWGVLLIILGCIAISAATLTTLVSMIFLGVLILLSGVVILVDAIKSWWGNWGGFFLHFVMGILYVIVGMLLIQYPVASSISFTFLLGIFYLSIGIIRAVYALSTRFGQWGFQFFSGLISLILGILILSNWPAGSLFIIGLFVGIDLIFIGIAYLMLSFRAKPLFS